jgi:ABC-type amino acid transport substrate-binding protein
MRRLIAALLIALAAFATPRAAGAEDDSLAAIRARGKLIAGVKFDTPPFGFLDDHNQPVGFDIDLVRAIGRHIGVPVELVAVTSPTRIPIFPSPITPAASRCWCRPRVR